MFISAFWLKLDSAWPIYVEPSKHPLKNPILKYSTFVLIELM